MRESTTIVSTEPVESVPSPACATSLPEPASGTRERSQPGPTRPAIRDRLTPVELERLTGIAEERLRSWSRRFAYPTVVPGRRRYLASEVPVLIATKQLIASGLPVGAAIDEARRRDALPLDTGVLAETFDRLEIGVVAFRTADPATQPLARAYANRSAADDFPRLDDACTRELLRMASHDHEPRVVWLESATSDQQHEALAFTIGAPTFSPALVVVMDLPTEARGVRSRDELRQQQARQRATANGLALARRQLQVHAGAAGLRSAFDAIRAGAGADDGFVALRYGSSLRGSISLCGRMLPSKFPPGVVRAFERAGGLDGPGWLDSAVVEALGGTGACLAIPLDISGVRLGYACLQFEGTTVLTPATQELLMSFGVMQASVMARERR